MASSPLTESQLAALRWARSGHRGRTPNGRTLASLRRRRLLTANNYLTAAGRSALRADTRKAWGVKSFSRLSRAEKDRRHKRLTKRGVKLPKRRTKVMPRGWSGELTGERVEWKRSKTGRRIAIIHNDGPRRSRPMVDAPTGDGNWFPD